MQRLKDQPLLFASAIMLSLIGGSTGLLLFWGAALFFKPVKEAITGVTNLTAMDQASPLYFVLFGALCLLSAIGVLKMKKWQKTGFFFYLAAQASMIFLPAIWLDWNAFSVANTIFTSVFVFIYLSFFRRMG
jgi:hypothetical protein